MRAAPAEQKSQDQQRAGCGTRSGKAFKADREDLAQVQSQNRYFLFAPPSMYSAN
jgi:hypothetical protein